MRFRTTRTKLQRHCAATSAFAKLSRGYAAQPEKRMSTKAVLIAIAAGALPAIGAAIITAYFATV